MKLLSQLSIIVAVGLLGEGISALLPFAFPSSVIAMLLLLLLLILGAVKERHIDSVADFFLKNMSLFFIPSATGILEHFGLISKALLPFLLICVLTTLLTFASTAWTVTFVRKLQKGGHSHD